ncbi:MAG TPA: nucleotide exchange factor GrpE [Conexibacter sp.]|nr:nucleotide exchange factor GrpE [Conexibacter sp.]
MSAEHDPQVEVEEQPVDGVHETTDADASVEEQSGVEVEHDLDELLARAGKADEYLALAQRTQADFENFRKRMTRDVAVAEQRGVSRLAKELLPALDNLGRALAAAEAEGEADGHLGTGVKLVQDELLAVLKRVGIEPFSPRGEPFDPNEHEAMAQQPVEGAEPGTVVEVYQQGFRHGESVLRPARVVVAA